MIRRHTFLSRFFQIQILTGFLLFFLKAPILILGFFGDQTAPSTNTYVNFFDLPEFDSFTLSSTGFSFEVDNIALGKNPVPEPSTMLLFGLGFLGLARVSRRKK